MHVISPKKLREFWGDHAAAEAPLRAWLSIIERRRYDNSHQLRDDFPTVDFLGEWRTVFNIGGNKFRLSVDIRYDLGRVYVRRVMTHADYDWHSKHGTL